ncbi:MAG: DUF4169 family protein [Hyphomicrobiales bacterium]|nr:DUF4169 family protein [Hyphomicrobiales bacterium]
MTEILSLSKARKARERADDRRRAEENRVRFGRTRAERETQALQDDLGRRRLDAHRRDETLPSDEEG